MGKLQFRECCRDVVAMGAMLGIAAFCTGWGACQDETPGGMQRANNAAVEPGPLAGADGPRDVTHPRYDWKVIETDELPEEAKQAIDELGRAAVTVSLLAVPRSNEEDGDAAAPLDVSFDTPSDPAEGRGFAEPRTVGALASLFRSLRDITDISLQRTNVRDEHLGNLRGLTALRGLGLHDTPVTDKGLANLTTLTGLTELSLDDNPQITNSGVANLAGLTKMESLGLGGTGITDAGLAHLRGMTELGMLTLDRTRITDAGLAHLAGMTKLYSLTLDGTKITDAGLKYLEKMDYLHDLRLAATQVSDVGLSHLCDLPIECLWLDGTSITDAGLASFREGMRELTQLSLIDTKVTKAGIDRLRRDVHRLRDHERGDATYIRIQAGSTISSNPASIDPATPGEIQRLGEVLWWLPARSQCVLVSQRPAERLFGRAATGEEGRFQRESTLSVFDALMQPQFVALADLAHAPLSLVVEASVAGGDEMPRVCHVCVFDSPLAERADAFVASLMARGAMEEAIGGTKITRLEQHWQTQAGEAHWTTVVARPLPDVLLFATDSEYLAELLSRMKAKGAERALPEDLPEWKHVDASARQWAIRHYTNADCPFVGVVYSAQAGDVAKVLCLCREEVTLDFVTRWWPANEGWSGIHQEVRMLDGNLVELSFAVGKKYALGDFLGTLFVKFQQGWQGPPTAERQP